MRCCRPLPWYPNDHGWHISLTRNKLKRHAAFHNLRRWLVSQTTNGFLSRQEAVSMLPPLVLAPLPDDIVLDMCAAPGSKTAQLIEALHAQVGVLRYCWWVA